MQACQNAELAPAACAEDLFTSHMLVLQQRWSFHFVAARLSRLMLSIEPPTVYLTESSDDEGMVCSGSRNDSFAFDFRNRMRNSQYPWLAVGVNDDIIGWQGYDVKAKGLVINTTPDQAFAILSDGETVVFPCSYGPDDGVFFKALHQGGIEDRGVTRTSPRGDTRLPKVVGPPGVHGTALVHCK